VIKANYEKEDLRSLSLSISKEAASLLRELAEMPSSSHKVPGTVETIEADMRSEDLILDRLKESGFSGKIITEERGSLKMGDDPIVAIIDPLDGSKNFSRSVKWCSISIAFADMSKEGMDAIIAGTVCPIFWDECISFSRGSGVYLEDRRVSREEALGFTRERRKEGGFYAVYIDEDYAAEEIAEIRRRLGGRKASFRSLGSAALELAYVAIGRIDAFVDVRSRLRIVDVAAGAGMVAEQGGKIMEREGNAPRLSFEGMQRFKSFLAYLEDPGIAFVSERRDV
jgi:myo-inositol-1(or 4)-monophosphatase